MGARTSCPAVCLQRPHIACQEEQVQDHTKRNLVSPMCAVIECDQRPRDQGAGLVVSPDGCGHGEDLLSDADGGVLEEMSAQARTDRQSGPARHRAWPGAPRARPASDSLAPTGPASRSECGLGRDAGWRKADCPGCRPCHRLECQRSAPSRPPGRCRLCPRVETHTAAGHHGSALALSSARGQWATGRTAWTDLP